MCKIRANSSNVPHLLVCILNLILKITILSVGLKLEDQFLQVSKIIHFMQIRHFEDFVICFFNLQILDPRTPFIYSILFLLGLCMNILNKN